MAVEFKVVAAMTMVSAITARGARWFDDVAATVGMIRERVAKPPSVRMVEGSNGQFDVQLSGARKGAAVRGPALRFEDGRLATALPANVEAALRGGAVELALSPDRFLFRPLELPSRAAEFLDGVVRGQIDRLTPWDPDHAAFGWTAPEDAGGGRIVITIAATAKAAIAPFLSAFSGTGIRSIRVSTQPPAPAPDAAPITIVEQDIGGASDARRMRNWLLAGLTACLIAGAGAAAADAIVGGDLQVKQDQLARRVSERRAAALAARNADNDPATAVERALSKKKQETPSSVIVLEVLSRILPDHTYVTELRIEGDKVRVVGVTKDAPGLIRLIEQSQHFTGATFFAPTTRAPSDPGDRFNIEARITPRFTL